MSAQEPEGQPLHFHTCAICRDDEPCDCADADKGTEEDQVQFEQTWQCQKDRR